MPAMFNAPDKLLVKIFLLFCCLSGSASASGNPKPTEKQAVSTDNRTLSLAGTWRFALDPEGVGIKQRWFEKRLTDTVRLPGTTDENQKGIKKDERRADRLSRIWYWKGAAWYQRDVVIPKSWKGKRVTLHLERTKTTQVWLDDTGCGSEDTLSAPQVFDLTAAATPGSHTLTVLVNNAKVPPVGPAHAIDERTQTNWNGIVGRIQLRAGDPVRLRDVQVYPDVENKLARVKIALGNTTGKPFRGTVTLHAKSWNTPTEVSYGGKSVNVTMDTAGTTLQADYKFGKDVPLWDEFKPAMIRLTVSLAGRAGNDRFADRQTVNFGMREFVTDRNRFLINKREVFLRGKLDCCFFPLTGYPPMNKEGWLRVFNIAKSYGINHYRFHSWCPPEAAFQAADQSGVYLAPELPNKSSRFGRPELRNYLRREGELIFKAYGNHPSFVMFTLGNELGRRPAMFEMVEHFQEIDSRRLYAQGSNNMHWAPSLAEGDDFWVTCKTRNKTNSRLPLRGSYFQGDFPNGGHIEYRPPSTMVDYSASIAGIPVPVVSHEVGQYQVFPDFREIPKYTGVLRARNLEIFRERLREAHMLEQAHDFVRASGALSVICYREDMEAALRTPGLGGFQLLDIQDFPGQGTALVGILNVFMESKGLITPRAWREFCCETVPLLRMKKYTWTTDETFIGRVQVAHYGPADLPGARLAWRITDKEENTIKAGIFDPVTIKQGKVFEVDMFAAPLEKVRAPQSLTVKLAIKGTPYRNDYDLWVYPSEVDTTVPSNVLVTRNLNEPATRKHLESGGRVLLIPKLDELPHSIKGAFRTDFWCFPMFRRGAERRGIEVAPGTLGLLCDPETPALARFPTEFHSNWQWWHLVKNSRPVILDDAPPAYRPLVQVIDNFERNHKLGLIFETRAGKGRLLVCSIDLLNLQEKPAARQLYHSLLQYTASKSFKPKAELEAGLLEKLLPGEKG